MRLETCTQCGHTRAESPVEGATRFCAQCGSPVWVVPPSSQDKKSFETWKLAIFIVSAVLVLLTISIFAYYASTAKDDYKVNVTSESEMNVGDANGENGGDVLQESDALITENPQENYKEGEAKQYVVLASKLNVRDQAGTAGNIVGQLGRRETYVPTAYWVDERGVTWHMVYTHNFSGWVNCLFTTPVERWNYPDIYRVVVDRAHFHHFNGYDFKQRHDFVVQGDNVKSYNEYNGFVYCEFINSRTGVETWGWISKSWVSM